MTYEASFIKRLKKLGIKKLILSFDTLAFIITFFLIYITSNGTIIQESANQILMSFIEISGSLFAIVLAGLAIVTSFTDKDFIYAWKKIEEFDNIITLFQYNMIILLLIMVFSLFIRFIYYNSFAMITLISIFVYMIVSLIDLVGFVSKYGLQRGEFIKQLKEGTHK
ncbi:MAG: hypothetical protein KJ906_01870 [Nanoarchaeota archaeon]|nr:hypothetical protein [Nanoarchaeota archaeon]